MASYQTVTSLTLGELWAIPTMLRLALIENLRRIGAGMSTDTIDRNRADHWARSDHRRRCERSEERDHGDSRHDSFKPTPIEFICRGVCSSYAGTRFRAGIAIDMD